MLRTYRSIPKIERLYKILSRKRLTTGLFLLPISAPYGEMVNKILGLDDYTAYSAMANPLAS